MRTLIVSQGLERNRILAAVSIHAPNKVVFMRNTNESSDQIHREVEAHLDTVKKTLLARKRGFNPYPFVHELEDAECDFFDVVDAYTVVSEKIQKERVAGAEVAVDVSAATKTLGIAMFLAAQANRAPVTYCKAAKYITSKRRRSEGDEIVLSAKEPVFLPQLPITIEPLAFGLLEKLDRPAGSITELIVRMGRKASKSELLSTARRLEKLEENGYVVVKREGKRKSITVTENGRKVAKLARSVKNGYKPNG
jgi:hypothetical protein